MKKIFLLLVLSVALGSYNAQAQWYKSILNSVSSSSEEEESSSSAVGSILSSLSEDKASAGIKEALIKGIEKGVKELSATDGYYGNPLVRIAFPEELQRVESTLRAAGFGSLADKGVQLLNRAAEDAASTATNIFVSSVKGMTIEDAVQIVAGKENAATNYLKKHTTNELTAAFSPIVEESLGKVNAPKYWNNLITKYNSLPLVRNQVEPDLTKYVTEKAIEGMFVKVAEEEKLIREDPAGRTSDILEEVFNR